MANNTDPSTAAGQEGDGPRRRDDAGSGARDRGFWDYMEILARPVAACITALAVALIGWMGQVYLIDRQEHQAEIAKQAQKQQTERLKNAQQEETRRAELARDYRLYTELMSKREEAESALRKDMFRTVISEFFDGEGIADGSASDDTLSASIERRLLKLEMLALNFGESLSLSPLFGDLNDDIDALGAGDDVLAHLIRDDYHSRLRKLARRVSARQVSALASGGVVFEFDVPVVKAAKIETYSWPEEDPAVETSAKESSGIVRSALSEHTLDCVRRQYTATFSNADLASKTIEVEVEIRTRPEPDVTNDPRCAGPDYVDRVVPPTQMEFALDFFNFPMVDNTRLSSDQRFAMIMERFEEEHVHIVGITFRGIHSSRRDKPFLDELLRQLRQKPSTTPPAEDDAAETPEVTQG